MAAGLEAGSRSASGNGERDSGSIRRGLVHTDYSDEDALSSDGEDEHNMDEGYVRTRAQKAESDPQESEEALVQSALRRIRRAQAKGREEVKLAKEELGAWDKRRKRLQEEESRLAVARKSSGSSTTSQGETRRRKDTKEARLAIPLSRLDPKQRPPSSQDDPLSRQPSLVNLSDSQGTRPSRSAYPPMGYFPPPSNQRRTGFANVRPSHRSQVDASNHGPPPPNQGYDTYVAYDINSGPINQNRRVTDGTFGRTRATVYGESYPYDEFGSPIVSSTPYPPSFAGSVQYGPLNSFQYQTVVSGPVYGTEDGPLVVPRRIVSGPPDMHYIPYRRVGGNLPLAPDRGDDWLARQRSGSGVSARNDNRPGESPVSGDEDESSSDEPGQGARLSESVDHRRQEFSVAEPQPVLELVPASDLEVEAEVKTSREKKPVAKRKSSGSNVKRKK